MERDAGFPILGALRRARELERPLLGAKEAARVVGVVEADTYGQWTHLRGARLRLVHVERHRRTRDGVPAGEEALYAGAFRGAAAVDALYGHHRDDILLQGGAPVDVSGAAAAQAKARDAAGKGEPARTVERELRRGVLDEDVALRQGRAHGVPPAVTDVLTGGMGEVREPVGWGVVELLHLPVLVEEAVVGGHDYLAASGAQELAGYLRHLGDSVLAGGEDLALGVAGVAALVDRVVVDHHERSVLDGRKTVL